MTISELYSLTRWTLAHIVESELAGLYTNIETALNRYAQPNQRAVSFEEERNELSAAVRNADTAKLTHAQIHFLETLGITPYVGAAGIANIEDLLYKNQLDLVASAEKFHEIAETLKSAVEKLEQIREGLDGAIPETAESAHDEILVRVTFAGKAGLRNLSEFKERGRVWYEIGRGIAMAHGMVPEDVRVVSAESGSIVVVLSTVTAIATTLSFIIFRGLKIADKVLDLRKKAEELRSMELKNDALAATVLQAAEEEKAAGVALIVREAAKLLKLTKNKNGEQIAALTKSVEQLLSFVENGGQVDFVLPENTAGNGELVNQDLQNLRETYSAIRALESKMALLTTASASAATAEA